MGLFTIGEIPFNEATIFNFQNRLKRYEDKHGVNLFNRVFDDLTQQQLKQLKLKTNIARTDSFMIDSNIKSYGRLQILIEVIKRLYRILAPTLKERISNKFRGHLVNLVETASQENPVNLITDARV